MNLALEIAVLLGFVAVLVLALGGAWRLFRRRQWRVREESVGRKLVFYLLSLVLGAAWLLLVVVGAMALVQVLAHAALG